MLRQGGYAMAGKIVCVVGPTACGKTTLGVLLAKQLGGEVVSADSMQIYRRMDIGTAKPTHEEMEGVPHHMLDVAEPEENFSVARYVDMAARCVDDILARGGLPIVAGGTGLYIDSLLSGRTFAHFDPDSALRAQLEERVRREGGQALLDELARADPDTAARLHPNDEKRIVRALEVYLSTGKTITQHNRETLALPPRYDALTITLAFQRREDMWARIDHRVDEMMERGLAQEVRSLLDSGVDNYRCFIVCTWITGDGVWIDRYWHSSYAGRVLEDHPFYYHWYFLCGILVEYIYFVFSLLSSSCNFCVGFGCSLVVFQRVLCNDSQCGGQGVESIWYGVCISSDQLSEIHFGTDAVGTK